MREREGIGAPWACVVPLCSPPVLPARQKRTPPLHDTTHSFTDKKSLALCGPYTWIYIHTRIHAAAGLVRHPPCMREGENWRARRAN